MGIIEFVSNNYFSWDKCEKGLKCNKCHTTVERLYHPDKYKRIFCDVIINFSSFYFRDHDVINLKYALSIILKKKDTKLLKSANNIEEVLK